jgi:hypothetical protein
MRNQQKNMLAKIINSLFFIFCTLYINHTNIKRFFFNKNIKNGKHGPTTTKIKIIINLIKITSKYSKN